MDKDTAVELFEIRCLGALAAAFQHAEKTPDENQWAMLRGEREVTMRDMGEISFATCMNFALSVVEKRHTKPEAD